MNAYIVIGRTEYLDKFLFDCVFIVLLSSVLLFLDGTYNRNHPEYFTGITAVPALLEYALRKSSKDKKGCFLMPLSICRIYFALYISSIVCLISEAIYGGYYAVDWHLFMLILGIAWLYIMIFTEQYLFHLFKFYTAINIISTFSWFFVMSTVITRNEQLDVSAMMSYLAPSLSAVFIVASGVIIFFIALYLVFKVWKD